MTLFTKDPASPEIIEALKKNGEVLLEVTLKRLYIVSHTEDLGPLMQQWFVKHRGLSHAYRDGSLIGGSDNVTQIRNLTDDTVIDLPPLIVKDK